MPEEASTPTAAVVSNSSLSAIAAWLQRVQWPLALLVVIVIVGVAAPFWNVPLSRDQGVYATCADVILSGGVPYQDCWDPKGPVLHYTYALAKLVFGVNSSGPYILNALAITATALALAAIAFRWMKQLRMAYAIGLLYGLLRSHRVGFGHQYGERSTWRLCGCLRPGRGRPKLPSGSSPQACQSCYCGRSGREQRGYRHGFRSNPFHRQFQRRPGA